MGSQCRAPALPGPVLLLSGCRSLRWCLALSLNKVQYLYIDLHYLRPSSEKRVVSYPGNVGPDSKWRRVTITFVGFDICVTFCHVLSDTHIG